MYEGLGIQEKRKEEDMDGLCKYMYVKSVNTDMPAVRVEWKKKMCCAR